MSPRLYRDYNSYLRQLFGCRVQKISIDAGLTCPNRDGTLGFGGCVFCNERGSGTGASRRSQSITEQIVAGKAYLAKRYNARKFLAYFQSFSNTYASFPVLKNLYEEALSDPDIVGLSIGTRPDCVSEEILDHLRLLAENRLIWMEYGLQSASDATLLKIGRGHSVASFQDAVTRTHARGIPVCAHVIVGLPGENRSDVLHTARFLASMPVQAVKIHLLYVVRGTTLEEWYQRGDYTPLSREEYVSLTGEFLTLLPPDMIIQRLTGDPHSSELVAPMWAMEKQCNLQAIHSFMEAEDLYQGKALKTGSPKDGVGV